MKCELCETEAEEQEPFNKGWHRYKVDGVFKFFCPKHPVRIVAKFIKENYLK